jgi:erythromycin esterase-like protein
MTDSEIINSIRTEAQPIESFGPTHLDELCHRMKDSRVVLLGEATHGSQEFYELRAQITMKLVREHDFRIVALEADWPDVDSVNRFIRGGAEWDGFHRFPEWMWRNHPFMDLTRELRRHNSSERHPPVSIFGLDLYSMNSSIEETVKFLEKYDPQAAVHAHRAMECLEPWRFDPSRYGYSVWKGMREGCEEELLALLKSLHEDRLSSDRIPAHELLSALQNARVAKNAEEYYRKMFEGSVSSWNMRDRHMFETLSIVIDHFGPDSKAIVWAHNSHLGDARATQMGDLGELNLGQLCRSRFGNACYSLGFLTDRGTVAAASEWGGDMEVKSLRPSRPDSFEHLFHRSGVRSFLLPLRKTKPGLREALRERRLERAVGVLYLPGTERSSHYFWASLADQFDEICWIDETRAVHSMSHVAEYESPDTFPTGL